MKIIFCAYRSWALKIYENLKGLPHNFLLIKNKKELTEKKCKKFKPDIILLYGWSWIVKKEILDICPCVCLHPSSLPGFRGGSPIQNQIIRGIKRSAVTLFYMDEGIDTGDIILQEEISFEGHLDEIFERLVETGTKLTKELLDGNMDAKPQDNSKSTFFPRRTPAQSKITIKDLQNKTAEELYDFIRALEDPYPNAFIKTKDGKKLLIKRVEIEK